MRPIVGLSYCRSDRSGPYQSRGYHGSPDFPLILDLALVVAFLSGDVKSAIYIVAAVCLCVPMTLIANSRRQDMTRNS